MKNLALLSWGTYALMTLTLLLGSEALHAQVTIAPSILFISSKSGIGDLYVTNNSGVAQEVTISFVFGFPDADSAGNPIMNYSDTVVAQTYSLNSMVQAYPRSFLLATNQMQTVRLQVRIKSPVKDAFYFTRIKIASNQKSPSIERGRSDSTTTQIIFSFNQILPVFYHKGNVSTGLDIRGVSTSIKDTLLTALADVERTGTAPFIGSMKAELFSADNQRVALYEATSAIYFRMKDKTVLDISKATKGQYRLVLTYETKRSDVAAEDLVQAPSVTKEVTVDIP